MKIHDFAIAGFDHVGLDQVTIVDRCDTVGLERQRCFRDVVQREWCICLLAEFGQTGNVIRSFVRKHEYIVFRLQESPKRIAAGPVKTAQQNVQ